MKIIKEISAGDTYAVRHPVLRPGKPVETCCFEGDERTTTKHFGLFENDELVGVASVFESNSHLFGEESQFQLRGMAVLEHHRGKNYGGDLVKHAEAYAKSKNAQMMWFNARVVAVPFYEKLGYEITGEGFDISDIGQHFVLFKRFAKIF